MYMYACTCIHVVMYHYFLYLYSSVESQKSK